MSEQQAIDVLMHVDPAHLKQLEEKVSPLGDGKPKPWLEAGLKDGTFKFLTIQRNGKDAAVVWYWISTHNKTLIVNAACALDGNDEMLGVIIEGVKMHCKNLGCVRFEWTTRSLAMIRMAKKYGGQVLGVDMVILVE